MSELCFLVVFVIGVFVSLASALNWHKYKALHLLPTTYAITVDILFRNYMELEPSLSSAVVFGAIAYVIAWLLYWQEGKERGQKKKKSI